MAFMYRRSRETLDLLYQYQFEKEEDYLGVSSGEESDYGSVEITRYLPVPVTPAGGGGFDRGKPGSGEDCHGTEGTVGSGTDHQEVSSASHTGEPAVSPSSLSVSPTPIGTKPLNATLPRVDESSSDESNWSESESDFESEFESGSEIGYESESTSESESEHERSRSDPDGAEKCGQRAYGVSHVHEQGSGTSKQDSNILNAEWKKEESHSFVHQFKGGVPGPRNPIPSTETAKEAFCRYFVDEVWDLIVHETNRFADMYRRSTNHQNSPPWHDVSKQEIQAFIGMLMVMAILQLPELEMYWSTHRLVSSSLSKVMTQTRFQQILRFLHLCDSSHQVPHVQPGYDPLFKVRRLLDIITPILQSEYSPHEQLAVSEAMIHFEDRSTFRRFTKAEPTKWGARVFALADAHNGYVFRFQVYTGKNGDLYSGLCSRVVPELINGLESCSYKVFCDTAFTSPALFLELYDKGINACGTVRSNKKYYPSALAVRSSDVPVGFYDYRSSGPLLACTWKDERVIHFLSTFHIAEGECTIPRMQFDGSTQNVKCPPCLLDYKQYTKNDQLNVEDGDFGDHNVMNIARRSTRWWMQVFAYVIEVATLNAYITNQFGHHRPKGKHQFDLLAFRKTLFQELIGSFTSHHELRLDRSQAHLPTTGDTKGECVVCAKCFEMKKLRRTCESDIQCTVCKVHLCVSARNCYDKYHTQACYWQ